MRIVVLGAAGTIGRATAPLLLAQGHEVRVVGRSLDRLRKSFLGAYEHRAADLATAEGCEYALEGADAAVYTLGLPYSKKDFAAYPDMMRHVVTAARKRGVGRVLLISNVYPYGKATTTPVSEDHPRVPCSVKGQHRKDQEDALLAAHGPDLWTASLRAPDFYGPHAELSVAHLWFQAAVSGGTADVLGLADTLHEWIYAPDLGATAAAFLTQDQGWGQGLNVPGPGTITTRAFVQAVFEAAGSPPKLRVLPPWLLPVAGLFMPILGELAEMSYLQKTPVILDGSRLEALLGALPRTPYAQGIAATVAWHRRQGA